MPDVDDALQELTGFAAHPPAAPAEVEALRGRAHRHRRNRRMLTGSVAVVCVVLLAGLGVAVFAADADDQELDVGNPTTLAPDTTIASDEVVDHDATVTPNEDLEDGSEVLVEFARTPELGLTGQCAVEAVVGTLDTGWCDVNIRPADSTDPLGGVPFNVVRTIETANGLVDCAERPRRCVIGAYGVDGEAMWAVISFREGLPSTPSSKLSVDRTAVADGAVVAVQGSGFSPGEDVFLSQCIGPEYPDCDVARGRRVAADEAGEFAIDFIVSAEVLPYDGRWRACEPCELRATAFRIAPATVPLTVESGATERRPRVEIAEPGPYAYEQRVTLRAFDFQIGAEPTIGWCNVPAGPDEYPNCVYPNEGFGSVPDQSGSFERTDFPLPKADFADGCLEECMLAWHPGEGSPAAFETRFTMQP